MSLRGWLIVVSLVLILAGCFVASGGMMHGDPVEYPR